MLSMVLGVLKKAPWYVWAMVVVLSVFSYQAFEIKKLKNDNHVEWLKNDSLISASDTTKQINGVLNDSLKLYQKRVVQLVDVKDDLEKKLHQNIKFKGDVTVSIDSLKTKETVVVQNKDSVKTANFNSYQEPISLQAHIEFRDTVATGQFKVSIDPLSLSVKLGCEYMHGEGIANVYIGAPKWAQVHIGSVQQDEKVCFTPPKLSWTDQLLALPKPVKLGGLILSGTLLYLSVFK